MRIVAIKALARFHPLPQGLMQIDLPTDEREGLLLSWLDSYDENKNTSLRDKLCEIYSNTSYVAFSHTLISRCLSCHVGSKPAAFDTNNSCKKCHPNIHATWSSSAHAQSLTHLYLPTLGSQPQQITWYDFEKLHGISCKECHCTVDKQLDQSAKQYSRCRYSFRVSSNVIDSCIRCHQDTYGQWQEWLSSMQPRKMDRPPGHIELGIQRDMRNCVHCHMPETNIDKDTVRHDHKWSARRNFKLLRQGIDVQIVFGMDKINSLQVQLILTNLSGHAYPTGTCRRALKLFAGDADVGELMPIAVISKKCPGEIADRNEQPLRPGEQRKFTISLPASTESVAYKLTYIRNLYDRQSYTIDISEGIKKIDQWIKP